MPRVVESKTISKEMYNGMTASNVRAQSVQYRPNVANIPKRLLPQTRTIPTEDLNESKRIKGCKQVCRSNTANINSKPLRSNTQNSQESSNFTCAGKNNVKMSVNTPTTALPVTDGVVVVNVPFQIQKSQVARKRTGGAPGYRQTVPKKAVVSIQPKNHLNKNVTLFPMICSLCGPPNIYQTRMLLLNHLRVDHISEIMTAKDLDTCTLRRQMLLPKKFKILYKNGLPKVEPLSPDRNEKTTASDFIHCENCTRKFTKRSAYEIHQEKHQSGELSCSYCSAEFNTPSALIQHVIGHSLEPEEIISMVSLILGGGISVSSRAARSIFKCRTCLKIFTIYQVFKRHLRLAEIAKKLPNSHQCPECGFTSRNICHMGVHMNSHQFQTGKSFNCKVGECLKSFRTHNGLVRHELEHEGKLNAVCKLCGGHFGSILKLSMHASRCVNEKQSFPCRECKRVFVSRWRLREHSNSHQSNVYFCDQCGREFKHLQSLNRHIKSKCGTEPWIFCDFCKLGFFTRKSLAAHLRETHTTESMFICQYCSGEFLTRVQLTRHEARHSRMQEIPL